MVTYQWIAQLVAVENGLQSTAFIAFFYYYYHLRWTSPPRRLWCIDLLGRVLACGELPSGVLAGLRLAS